MNDERAAFLAGDRPEDVAIYLANDALDAPEKLEPYGEAVEGGVVLVVDGERGRGVFETATGVDPMAFARSAATLDGHVHADLTGGDCPDADPDGDGGAGEDADGPEASEDADGPEAGEDADGPEAGEDTADPGTDDGSDGSGEDEHATRFVFAFAEAQKDDADDRYGEGDVIHAYAQCSCGAAYSAWWLAGDRDT